MRFSLSFLGRMSRLTFACLALACVSLAPSSLRAADEPQHELDDATRTGLEKLQPLVDAKNWDGALALLSGLAAKVKPDSFDMALISDIEAKVYLQKGDYAKVIPPWERALRLTDQYHYLSSSAVEDMIYYLAQVYYQEASASKDHAFQQQAFTKATAYLERWLGSTKKTQRDAQYQDAFVLYASLLYNQAVIDEKNINFDLLKKAEVQAERGLRLSVHPNERFYILLLAIGQQRNEYAKLADILELLVKQYPSKKDYWSQLAGVYVTLATEEQEKKNSDKAREYNIRAILAIERAHELGFMRTPKDNYTLVGIYFNVGQYGRATELLHAGLRDGSIESALNNWELLAYSYQQVDRPLQAVDALKEAEKQFPKSGQLDYQIAQIYYSLNRPEDSYKHLKAATTKGDLDKPGAVYGFLAYVCWELDKLTEAVESVDKALQFPDGAKDTQLPRLKASIEERLRDREQAKEGDNKL
jgi:predicted Zn-dependent protease